MREPTRGRVRRAGRVALLMQHPGAYALHDRVADASTAEVLGGGWYFATQTARVLGGGALLPEEGAALIAVAVPQEVT